MGGNLIYRILEFLMKLLDRKQPIENKKISPTEVNIGDITININIGKD